MTRFSCVMMSVAGGRFAPSMVAWISSWSVYLSRSLYSPLARRNTEFVMSMPTKVVRASTTPSLAPVNAWLMMFCQLALCCALDWSVNSGTMMVPVFTDSSTVSLCDANSTSSAVVVLFACGPLLF